MRNKELSNAVKNINALYNVVGEIQGRLIKLENQDVIELPDIRLDLTVDTPILVRQKPDDLWRKAYFARWDLNDCVAWYEGRTSWSASNDLITIWSEWKLPEENSE